MFFVKFFAYVSDLTLDLWTW